MTIVQTTKRGNHMDIVRNTITTGATFHHAAPKRARAKRPGLFTRLFNLIKGA